jgi:hypothetical protein
LAALNSSASVGSRPADDVKSDTVSEESRPLSRPPWNSERISSMSSSRWVALTLSCNSSARCVGVLPSRKPPGSPRSSPTFFSEHVCVYTCICLCVCVCVCACVCLHVYMHICIYVYVNLCIHLYLSCVVSRSCSTKRAGSPKSSPSFSSEYR